MKTFLIENEASFLDKMKGSNGDSNSKLNSRLLVQWAYNIAKGMRYLSRKHIMHGDLAARNILIGRGKSKYRSTLALKENSILNSYNAKIDECRTKTLLTSL